jgi:prepilin-type N-terminal cleavage/methylation domain-containing protein
MKLITHNSELKTCDGFTLIELLITISLIIAISTVSFLYIFKYKQVRDLQFTTQEITTVLRNAQNRSTSQEDGSAWGVHFENTQNGFFNLFEGADYDNSTSVSRTNLRSTIKFDAPALNDSSTIIFSPISGLPSALTTVKISLISDTNTSTTVTINPNGEIVY